MPRSMDPSQETQETNHQTSAETKVTLYHVGSETVSPGLAPTDSSVGCKLHIEYFSATHKGSVIKEDSSTVEVDGLIPGTEYTFSFTRVAVNGNRSKSATVSVCTDPVPPVQITVCDVSSESLSLQWDTPAGEVECYIVICCSDGETVQELTVVTNSLTISSLRPGVFYSFEVFTQLKNGRRSKSIVTSAWTNVPPPEVTHYHISSETVSLGLAQTDSPVGCKLHIEYFSATHKGSVIKENSSTVEVEGLIPGTEYTFSFTRVAVNGNRSKSATVSVCTDPVPPVQITVCDVSSESLSLQWDTPAGEVECYIVTCCSDGETVQELTVNTNSLTISSLRPGVFYSFEVFTQLKNGRRSKSTVTSACTNVPSPEVTVLRVGTEAVLFSLVLTDSSVGCQLQGSVIKEDAITVDAEGLIPGTKYIFTIPREAQNGSQSKSATVSVCTETHLKRLLEDLGLAQHYTEKLSLSKILQIDERTITDEPVKCNTDLPWYFLKKLMMVNVKARNVKCTSMCECDTTSKITELNFGHLPNCPNSGQMPNPLDIITALFHCSDAFVQQEMALKMSMCQFSVPLVLPNCDKQQCTLMLWAMRDIVKKYRPQSHSDFKGFIEDRIVLSELPMISFVRLGECSLSKSEILNKLLSNSHQYHDTFVHHNMDCGDSPRRISNGLVEITWYLPCGNKNIDIFSEPVVVANLRGDIALFETQYSFLCHTSSAVFVFFDSLNSDCKLLTNQHNKAQIFLVGNHQSCTFSLDALKEVATKLGLTNSNIILKTKLLNNADFVKNLRKTVSDVVENSKVKIQVEHMAHVANELGISVDEDCPECQTAKKNADVITAEIQDIFKYKEAQLPLQGQIWKELTSLEKKEFRLRKAGSENIETYKSELQKQQEELRDKQNSYDMSSAMTCFINKISSPGIEKCYFLKWLQMNLNNLSGEKLSDLRELYKKKCNNSENKDEIKDIDKQLSNSSLGTEHFFREMGQIYEASVSLPETHPSRQQLQHLPKLCAQLLLYGFPLELVDGDASNIPLRWVSDVLTQLNKLVSPNNKILVVTVLGVQSTGKSTLLNTMFGVQFAVSSGRCTRGAFMLLIRVSEDVKKVLNCDYMVIIDTEGLKSPELAQLDDSHEHDNELATLVVGLSDVTIINIAMENLTEMKDILQIVVHAFLRMKEVGKKPKCLFVHQNVSDVSAHEKNMRDRKLLLQQLNEMTQAAARMEKKEEYTSFTDVMEYNPDTGNWYIPGLWNGNPPMAPVNAGYSEAVYELKKNIIHLLGECESSGNNILEFQEWMRSLWTAVKHENFIFSFRNSLVADAYMRLCTEFNKWEWEFKKEMYTWVTNAETKISNFGIVAVQSDKSDIGNLLTCFKSEASTVLTEWEKKLLDNLTQYFEQTERHVYLVEGYREEFSNSAISIRREIESSVFNQLTAAAEMKQGMTELDRIMENHTKETKKAVHALIDECQKKDQMTDEELDKEFDKMWNETLSKLTFSQQKTIDVFSNVSYYLRANVSPKGSHACQLLSEIKLQYCGAEPIDFTVKRLYTQSTHKMNKSFNYEDQTMKIEKMADSIINACTQFVTEKVERKNNYHETYIQEILHMINEKLLTNQDVKIDTEFEVFLKLHICAFAAKHFQKMHEDFLRVNDPYKCLNQNKEKLCANFKDVFREQDQCQKKAEEFTNRCLMPAVKDLVNRSRDLDIIDEMQTTHTFSTQLFFQYSVLLDLLEKDGFENYFNYICSYEDYLKQWILDQIRTHFSGGSKISEFEDQHLQSSVSSINNAINKAKMKKSDDLKTFVEDICKELGEKLIISQDAISAFLILNIDVEQFAHWLTMSVKDMAKTLTKKFKKSNRSNKKIFNHLLVNPQNELFTKLIGCGKQCPFCKSPCEAGAKEHSEHWASLHRPRGLGQYKWNDTKQLITDTCPFLVISETHFCCAATNNEWHSYNCYKEIFPDWKIPPDMSLQASDYWKYVMAKFNDDFAKKYGAEKADIPSEWTKITHEQAVGSLKESFNIK